MIIHVDKRHIYIDLNKQSVALRVNLLIYTFRPHYNVVYLIHVVLIMIVN